MTIASKTKFPSPNYIAWMIPIVLLIHQMEEYFGEFPQWYSNVLNVQLSNQDFIVINSIGLFVITIASFSYYFNKSNFILVALGTLIFVNGWVHVLASLFTLAYSPGAISGLILFIPLGFMIYKQMLPKLKSGEKVMAITIGVLALLIVSTIASNI